MANENSLIIRINGDAKSFLDELDKIKKKTEDVEKVLSSVSKANAIAFAALSAAVAVTTNEFINYEKALVAVGKTTGIEGTQLTNLGKTFQKLSEEIPVSTNELLNIAQAAGSLGISAEKDLVKFTKTIAKLGVASDLHGEQAAATLARILTVTKENIGTIDTFASVIVRLGNEYAATESEIARMTNEVARSTAVFEVSSTEAAALGTALKSMGIAAELGGSVVGKAFQTIQKAITFGGKPLEDLVKLTGLTGAQLKKTFEEDSTKVFQLFIEGLGKIRKEVGAGGVIAELEKFKLKGDEVNKVLPVLATNAEFVGKALATAADEAKKGTALEKEAAAAFNTLGSEIDRMKNAATNAAVKIGESLAPSIKEIAVDITSFLKRVNNLDTEIIQNTATLVKWGAIITGAIAGLTAVGLAVIKISAIITALSAAFLPATIAASGFWIALTGPVGIAVAGLVAVTAGVIALNKTLDKGEKPKTIEEINYQLAQLKERRDELQKNNNFSFRNQTALDNIRKEIKELERLREAKVKATEDFGTGSLLVRPEADKQAGLNLGASAFGLEEQTIPFIAQGEDKAVEQTKQSQESQTELVNKETQKRIDKLRKANEEALMIQKARDAEVTQEEKDVAEKRAQIEFERVQAKRIVNAEERALALSEIDAKYAEEEKEIEKFESKKEERALQRAEKKREFDLAFKELSKEDQALFDEEDRIRLEEKTLTEQEQKQLVAEQELARRQKERELYLQEEAAFGTAVATLNQFFRNKEVEGVKTASSQLVALTQSKNATLKGIGKAAAHTNAALATAEGAIKAYSSLAGIPIVGPALGFAAAGALIAFGVEQQQQIAALNSGGIVPGGGPNVDSVLTYLTPGEFVVPRNNFDEVVEGTARERGFSRGDESGTGTAEVHVIVEPKGEFIGLIEQQIYTRRLQGIGNT